MGCLGSKAIAPIETPNLSNEAAGFHLGGWLQLLLEKLISTLDHSCSLSNWENMFWYRVRCRCKFVLGASSGVGIVTWPRFEITRSLASCPHLNLVRNFISPNQSVYRIIWGIIITKCKKIKCANELFREKINVINELIRWTFYMSTDRSLSKSSSISNSKFY